MSGRMLPERIERDFNGAPLGLYRQADGSLWMTRDELARGLGYADEEGLARLVRRHAGEVARFRGAVTLTAPSGGGAQEVAAFEERALYILACLARTKVGASFRAWVADLCADLRAGRKGIADADAVQRLMLDVADLKAEVAEERAARLRFQADAHAASVGMRVQAQKAGGVLSEWSRAAPRLKVLAEEPPDQALMFTTYAQLVADRAKNRGDGCLTPTEAAALIGCSVRTLKKKGLEKAGPTRRPYRLADISALLAPRSETA